jgi:hypothetical protein
VTVLAIALGLFVIIASLILVGITSYSLRDDASRDEFLWPVEPTRYPVETAARQAPFADPGRVRIGAFAPSLPDPRGK